jgi:anti-sigma-K factor RskA
MDLHDLTAAYALDALDGDEVEAYERHLSQCEECRAELAGLNETAAALAFGTVAPAPPARLRAAILETAAAERSNVVPLLRRRWVARGLAVAAAAAACIAVGLAVALTRSSQPHMVSMSLSRGAGGKATVHFTGLAAVSSDKTYELWVIAKHKAPQPAGLFRDGTSMTVHLKRAVPRGAIVAVTIEHAGGTDAPTSSPIVSARA